MNLVTNIALVLMTALALILGGRELANWWSGPFQERPREIDNWTEYAQGNQIGPSDAAVTIVEFGDYECPYCKRAASEIQAILDKYPKEVRFIYRHYPLAGHSNAIPAARAALCADQQGRFEDYHNLLFESSDSLAAEPWMELAAIAGIGDAVAFRNCIGRSGPLEAIARDTAAANRLEIRGTPLFLVNDLRLSGYPEEGYIEEHVEEALRDAAATAFND